MGEGITSEIKVLRNRHFFLSIIWIKSWVLTEMYIKPKKKNYWTGDILHRQPVVPRGLFHSYCLFM